jgi:hypothetical protein
MAWHCWGGTTWLQRKRRRRRCTSGRGIRFDSQMRAHVCCNRIHRRRLVTCTPYFPIMTLYGTFQYANICSADSSQQWVPLRRYGALPEGCLGICGSVQMMQQFAAVLLCRTHCCSGALPLSSCAASRRPQTDRWWRPAASRGVCTYGRPAAGGCCAPGPRTTGCVARRRRMPLDTGSLECTDASNAPDSRLHNRRCRCVGGWVLEGGLHPAPHQHV